MLLLLAVPFALLWLLIAGRRERIGFGALSVRGAFVLAYLAFELLLLLITEVTSIGHHFTAGVVAAAWALASIALALVAWPEIRRLARRASDGSARRAEARHLASSLGVEGLVWIGVVAIIMIVLVVVGLRYPPANGDSMVYHLARVEHWVQNRSVAPFATHYLAQVELAPLSEYNLAHIQLLSGTDRWDWTMQWCAALVSVVAVTEFARLLAGSRTVQVTAAVICATVPSGILLATSTENDYFVAAICIGLLVILASFTFGPGWGYRVAAAAVATGLAWLAKGTSPTLIGPAALALVAIAVVRHRRSRLQDPRPATGGRQPVAGPVAAGAVLAVVVLVVVAGPFLVQNEQTLRTIVGPISQTTVNRPITADSFGSSVVRSLAGNFAIGNGHSGPEYLVSSAVLRTLGSIHTVFHLSPVDPRFSIAPPYLPGPFTVADYSLDQRLGDQGANPLQVVLMLATLVILAVGVVRRWPGSRAPLLVGAALACGYVLFSGAAKWTQFDVRYSMPLFVAWSAVIAIALCRTPGWVRRVVLVVLVVGCLPQLLDNGMAPLVSAASVPAAPKGVPLIGYFPSLGGRPNVAEAESYQTITTAVAQSTCRRVGLGNWVLFEYPLWAGLQDNGWRGTLDDVDVHNQTRGLEPRVPPCAVITQQGRSYTTPRDGKVHLQVGGLALSLAPADAVTVTTPVPGFSSTAPGVHLLPGGGWAMAVFPAKPWLAGSGSLFLFSAEARWVQLQLTVTPGRPASRLTVVGSAGAPVPARFADGRWLADLDVRAGTNVVHLTDTPSAPAQYPILVLDHVGVVPEPG